jgi:hypothetical protein
MQILGVGSGVTMVFESVDGRRLVRFTPIVTGMALPPGTFRPQWRTCAAVESGARQVVGGWRHSLRRYGSCVVGSAQR